MNVKVRDFIKGDKLRRYMLMDNTAAILILDFVVFKDGLLVLIKHEQMLCLDIADAERTLNTLKVRGRKEIRDALKEHGESKSVTNDNNKPFSKLKTVKEQS